VRDLLDYLDGHKTYVAFAAWILFHVLTAGKLIVVAQETFDVINVTLLGAAGIAMRAGIKKGEAPRD
jgi:hypothetical protein